MPPERPVDARASESGRTDDVVIAIRAKLLSMHAVFDSRTDMADIPAIPGTTRKPESYLVPAGTTLVPVALGKDGYLVGGTRYGLVGFDRVPLTTVQSIVESDVVHASERASIISASERVERPTRGNRLRKALQEMGGEPTPVIDRFIEMHYDLPQGDEEHVSVVVFDHSTYAVGGVLFETLPMEYMSDTADVQKLIRLDMAHMRFRNALLRDSVENTEGKNPPPESGNKE